MKDKYFLSNIMETLTVNAKHFSSEFLPSDDVKVDSINHVEQNRTSNCVNRGRKNNYIRPKENSIDKEPFLNGGVGTKSKSSREIPSVVIPGDFEFIDDTNMSQVQVKTKAPESFKGVNSKSQREILSVVIPGEFDFIDDTNVTHHTCKATPVVRNSEDSLEKINESNRETISSGLNSNRQRITTSVVIPGDFDFIDDTNVSSLTCKTSHASDSMGTSSRNPEKGITASANSTCLTNDINAAGKAIQSKNSTGAISKRSRDVPSVVIPGDYDFIDDSNTSLFSRERLQSKCSIGTISKTSGEIPSAAMPRDYIVGDSTAASIACKTIPTKISTDAISKRQREIPSVVIPGDFDFIDEINASSLTKRDIPLSLLNGVCYSPSKSTKSDSFSLPSPGADTPVIFKIPSIYLPSNIQYIDEIENASSSNGRKLQRGDKTHSSLRIPRNHSTKRRLCRHHSDSEAKAPAETSAPRQKHHRSRSRKVRRSVSAIETNKDNYKTRVRRSLSDRSGMMVAGKHLRPPSSRSRPHSHYENGSSRCSSTRTLSTNVSISEIVAVEMGLKDIPGLTPKEARRRRIVCTVGVVALTIIVVCILLVAVTLLLSPEVDDLLRKGNEEIYRSMAAGASTSSPTTEGAAVVANNSAPPSGSPG